MAKGKDGGMMKKPVWFLLTIVLVTGVGVSAQMGPGETQPQAKAGEKAQEKSVVKKYPPYPDVWGYELPWPEKNSRHSGSMIFKKGDGDYVAMYIKQITKVRRKNGSCCDLTYEHAGLSFFYGEKSEGTEVAEFEELLREDRVPRKFGKRNLLILTDGSDM